jgi:hypothetical protein
LVGLKINQYLYIMIQGIRKHIMFRTLYCLLLLNFINLTANFYQPSSLDSTLLKHHDPIDNLTELIVEFLLGCDDDLIPDTELPVDKRKFFDIQLIPVTTSILRDNSPGTNQRHQQFRNDGLLSPVDFEITPPPPKYC